MAFRPELNSVYWEIVYYAGSMVPKTKTFTTELEAVSVWDDWVKDPLKGAVSLKKIEIIRKAE